MSAPDQARQRWIGFQTAEVRLLADGEELKPALMRGNAEIRGLAGTELSRVIFSQFLTDAWPPDVLGFLARHDNPTVRYQAPAAMVGGQDLQIDAVGCRLLSADLIEDDSGLPAIRYTFSAHHFEGTTLTGSAS